MFFAVTGFVMGYPKGPPQFHGIRDKYDLLHCFYSEYCQNRANEQGESTAWQEK